MKLFKTYREKMFDLIEYMPDMADAMIRALDEETLEDLYRFFEKEYDIDEEDEDDYDFNEDDD